MGSKRAKKLQPALENRPDMLDETGRFDVLSKLPENYHEDAAFDYEKRLALVEPEIVLVDSDDDDDDATTDRPMISEANGDIIIDVSSASDSESEAKPPTPANELTENQDFIGFGDDSSDSEMDEGEYSDDGIILGDEVSAHHRPRAQLPFPWIKDHDHLKEIEIADWLTEEMKDFVNYISPSKKEIETRNRIIDGLKLAIKEYWPECTAHVFGLSATDLYLPELDIDMVVVLRSGTYEERSRLYQLSLRLRQLKLATKIEVIAKTKVPIIKFVDPQLGVHVDISFERVNGIHAAQNIRKWIAQMPGLREMVLIIKQFLSLRKLNNPHVGGLGGYATIIMAYHFLRMHPKVSSNTMSVPDNLGPLLIEFFELYGRNINYDIVGLSLGKDGDTPCYIRKEEHRVLNTSRNPYSIVIQDPLEPENNITRATFALRDIKKAFGGAFQLLTARCYELNQALYKQRLGQLILGDIIKYRGKERNFIDERDLVPNQALIGDRVKLHGDDSPKKRRKQPKEVYLVASSSDDNGYEPTFEDRQQLAKKVMDLMGIDDDDDDNTAAPRKRAHSSSDDDSDDEARRAAKRLKLVNKDTKRDFWLAKGNELTGTK